MITIAFEFKTLSEAHAALGMLMATQQQAATAVEAPATNPAPTETVEAPKKKRGRPAATVFSIEEVEDLKREFTEFTKNQGFLPAKNLLKQFKVPRFSALTSKQHQPFATAMRKAAA